MNWDLLGNASLLQDAYFVLVPAFFSLIPHTLLFAIPGDILLMSGSILFPIIRMARLPALVSTALIAFRIVVSCILAPLIFSSALTVSLTAIMLSLIVG